MSIAGISGNLEQGFGWLFFDSLELDGQLNIYSPIQFDLQPFFRDDTEYITACFKVIINVAIRSDIFDYTLLSKRSGYPDRYDIGQFRWLSGGNTLELQFIDTIQWQEPIRRPLWVVKTGTPDRTFPTGEPTTFNVYDFVASLSSNTFAAQTYPQPQISCEEFAWSIKPGVRSTVVVYYYFQAQNLLKADLPSGPIPAYFFFM